MANAKFHWSGWGKWLSFALAIFLMLLALPLMLHRATGAAAGWNIFLGLLIFGSVVSNNKRAPLLLVIIAVLMFVRFVFTIIYYDTTPDIIISSILVIFSVLTAFDLRRQDRMPQA